MRSVDNLFLNKSIIGSWRDRGRQAVSELPKREEGLCRHTPVLPADEIGDDKYHSKRKMVWKFASMKVQANSYINKNKFCLTAFGLLSLTLAIISCAWSCVRGVSWSLSSEDVEDTSSTTSFLGSTCTGCKEIHQYSCFGLGKIKGDIHSMLPLSQIGPSYTKASAQVVSTFIKSSAMEQKNSLLLL